MSTTEPPHPEVDCATEIQSLYIIGMFPDVDQLMLGDIISGCWQGAYAFDMQIIS